MTDGRYDCPTGCCSGTLRCTGRTVPSSGGHHTTQFECPVCGAEVQRG